MSADSELLRIEVEGGVATLTMNHPRRLNGWTLAMQAALREGLKSAAERADVKAVILTGTGAYYSAGADLGGAIRLGHPRALRDALSAGNHQLFDQFIQFPKPILAAVNGHSIGAPVTSAALCDAIVAAEGATFLTPFAKVGLPPEGASSVHFARLMGEAAAERMLGAEGWRPSAEEALEVGLVDEVVPSERLLEAARRRAEGWVAADKPRELRGGSTKAELEAANERESEAVADAFFSAPFLMNQYRFFAKRKKYGPALTFLALRATRPAWALLL